MSQDKERELLPCPFCGSKEVSVANEEPHDNSGGYFIFCGECGASTNLRFAHGDDPVPLLREQWNRRAALASQQAVKGEPVEWQRRQGDGAWINCRDRAEANYWNGRGNPPHEIRALGVIATPPAPGQVERVDALLPDIDTYRAKYANVLTLTDDMCYGYECAREELRAALATQQAGKQKEIKHVQLDHDSNSTEPEQQRGMASSVAMGQPVGHGQDASACNIGAQGIQPVAEIAGIDEYGPCLNWYRHWTEFAEGTKLYASPPSREPLTDEALAIAMTNSYYDAASFIAGVRFAEIHHGIHSRGEGEKA